MKRFGIILLLLVAVVTSAVAVLMARDRHRLMTEAAQSHVTLGQLKAETQKLRTERDQLQRDLDAARKAVATPAVAATAPVAQKAVGEATAKDSAKAVTPKQGMKAWAEMLDKPEMKDMIRQQQYAAMESQYGSLFAKFQFDEAEKEDFKKLVVDRLMAETDMGLKAMNTELTKEERDAIGREIQEATKASDAKIRDFLNSDADYATFKNWEDTKSQRMQIEMGRSIFANSGEPLSSEQEERLISTMHEVSRRPGDTPDMSKPQNFDPTRFGPADIEKQLARQDRNAQAVLEASGQFLSPKQVAALRTMQSQWRTMSETGLRMSSAMFKAQ